MILSISFRPGNFATGSIVPETISLEHWRFALGMPYQGADGRLIEPDLPVLRWLWNSVKVATLSALIGLLLSTTAAYAFARMKFVGKKAALTGLMLMQMFPAVLALVAIYAIFDRIGNAVPAVGIDTHWALLLAYSGGIALHVWTIKGYYETIPVEIEEAAKVDGATPLQAFRLVLLPMAVPILMVVFLLAFIGAIIEYPVAFGPKVNVNYILHKGDTKDQGGKDMSFDGSASKEIWVNNGDRKIYTSLDDANKARAAEPCK